MNFAFKVRVEHVDQSSRLTTRNFVPSLLLLDYYSIEMSLTVLFRLANEKLSLLSR
jgi:hypothetical protein